ncbi:MAG: tetratricopeptide repeat protein [Candidatus Heimdallarchaeota archaeon]
MVELDKEKRAFLFALTSEALSLMLNGKKDEALQCYDKILKKYPEELQFVYRKGMVHYELEEFADAIKFFDDVIQKSPEDVDALYAKGTALSSLEKHNDAVALFDKILNIDPKMHLTWLAKGYTLLDLEKYEDALSSFEGAEKLGYRGDLLGGKGQALRMLGKTEEAKIYFKEAIVADPYDFEALFGLGMLEYEQNNIKEAQELLYKSVVQYDDNVEAWKTLAEIFKKNKDTERESVALQKVKELQKK